MEIDEEFLIWFNPPTLHGETLAEHRTDLSFMVTLCLLERITWKGLKRGRDIYWITDENWRIPKKYVKWLIWMNNLRRAYYPSISSPDDLDFYRMHDPLFMAVGDWHGLWLNILGGFGVLRVSLGGWVIKDMSMVIINLLFIWGRNDKI